MSLSKDHFIDFVTALPIYVMFLKIVSIHLFPNADPLATRKLTSSQQLLFELCQGFTQTVTMPSNSFKLDKLYSYYEIFDDCLLPVMWFRVLRNEQFFANNICYYAKLIKILDFD